MTAPLMKPPYVDSFMCGIQSASLGLGLNKEDIVQIEAHSFGDGGME
jgi:hypothetical protein